jgi:hypothetical protein
MENLTSPSAATLGATLYSTRTDPVIQGDQKCSVYSNTPHTIDDLKMAITEYIPNVDRAILNTVLENTVRRVNKCLETGGGHFEHYLLLSVL